jgi:hypothetical protein
VLLVNPAPHTLSIPSNTHTRPLACRPEFRGEARDVGLKIDPIHSRPQRPPCLGCHVCWYQSTPFFHAIICISIVLSAFPLISHEVSQFAMPVQSAQEFLMIAHTLQQLWASVNARDTASRRSATSRPVCECNRSLPGYDRFSLYFPRGNRILDGSLVYSPQQAVSQS